MMELILACGGKDGWRSIFSNAIDYASVADDASAANSRVGDLPVIRAPPSARVMAPRTPSTGSPLPNNIPMTLEFRAGDDSSTINDTRVESKSMLQDGLSLADAPQAVFKVVDPKGNTHRIRSELNVDKIMAALA